MIDTPNKRAAALGFGLAFLLVLPQAEGALTVEGAGHALSAYRFDLDDQNLELPDGDIIMIPADPRVVILPADPTVFVIDDADIVMMPRSRRP